MKLLLVSIACTFFLCVFGQSRVFRSEAKRLIEASDSIQEIEAVEVAEDEYNYLSEGMDRMTTLCLSELKSISRNRPDELKTSQTLTTLAQLATKAWKGSQYSSNKRWFGISKHFRRAFERTTAKFNYTKQVSFRIKLVQNNNRAFYVDKKVGISETDLYKGKKPKNLTKEEKEALPDPEPLPFMTEEELLKQFLTQVRHKRVITDLKRGKYAFVGMSMQVDTNTLSKNKIPTARVVVVVGARRLRDIRLKKRYYVKGEE